MSESKRDELAGYVDVLTDAENFSRRARHAFGRLSVGGPADDFIEAKTNIRAAIARLEGALAAIEDHHV